jgi:Type II secretion system (T2SS), protein E, N-terminal domain
VQLGTAPAKGKATAAPSTEAGHGRRLGELLIEEKLVTREQLDEALRVQSTLTSYIPLGQVLMMRGCVTRAQLTALLRRYSKRARLGELLVRAKRVTPEQLQNALARQAHTRQPLGHTLISLGYVTEETMREALCTQLHINFFDLDRIPLDPLLARLVNEKYATKRRAVPLFRSGQLLVVAVDDPTDVALVEDLQQLLRLRIEIVTSTTAKILRALTRLYGSAPRMLDDPCLHPNIMIGLVHDQEIADLAARILKVRILPPYWQSAS